MDGRSEGLESEFEEKWFGGMNLEVWESREGVKCEMGGIFSNFRDQ